MVVSGRGGGILGPSSLAKTVGVGASLAMTLTRFVWPLVDAVRIPRTVGKPLE